MAQKRGRGAAAVAMRAMMLHRSRGGSWGYAKCRGWRPHFVLCTAIHISQESLIPSTSLRSTPHGALTQEMAQRKCSGMSSSLGLGTAAGGATGAGAGAGAGLSSSTAPESSISSAASKFPCACCGGGRVKGRALREQDAQREVRSL